MDYREEYDKWKAKAILLGIFDRYRINEETLELEGLKSELMYTLYGKPVPDSLKNIKTLQIPKVKSIGIKALSEIQTLERVDIPNTVRFIRGGAFYNCKNLTEVNFASGDVEISGTAFDGTPWLKEMQKQRPFLVTKKDNGDVVLHKVFSCPSFGMPLVVNKISEAAFRNNRRLQVVSFDGSSVNMIPENCFRSAFKLWSVKLSNNIKSIGFRAFFGCRDLEQIVIPEGVERIEALAFAKCKNLTSVVLPSTLKVIETCAFANSPIAELVIPESVDYIYNDIVGGEYSLTVKVPKNTKILTGAYNSHTFQTDDYEYGDFYKKDKSLLDDDLYLSPERCSNKEYPIEADEVDDVEALRKAFAAENKYNETDSLWEYSDFQPSTLIRY